MLRNEKYVALNTLNEYLAISSFSNEYVTGTPAPGQFSYDTTLEAIHLNSDGSKSRFFEFITDKLKIGDLIEAEVEIAYNGNGDLGKVIIVDTANANNYYQVLSKNSTAKFEKLSVKHVVRQSTTFKVGVGISSGATGNIKIRNFKVKTKSSFQQSNSRKIVIEGNNAFSSKFSIRTDFAIDPATISVGTDGIVVTWTNPLNGSKRPIPSVGMDYTGNSPKYIVRVGTVNVNSFVVRFYNATTGALVNIADLDLSSSVFAYITCNT